jgi:hypothetical protein
MLPSIGEFSPASSRVNGVHDNVIAGTLRSRRWKAESDTPGFAAAHPLNASEISGDLATDAFPFRPGKREW